ncbi:hypothetical protein NPX13_g9205 [Xylaria arbuscula]|uniref:Uncharacterized protein n=1 Tax=Xylaria arbuscula TaxID=114810 RepID=A0A9W8N6U0_9PEZI|nr:hypothetical protein NPX13_g9205 [Xylaria arbuscula]
MTWRSKAERLGCIRKDYQSLGHWKSREDTYNNPTATLVALGMRLRQTAITGMAVWFYNSTPNEAIETMIHAWIRVAAWTCKVSGGNAARESGEEGTEKAGQPLAALCYKGTGSNRADTGLLARRCAAARPRRLSPKQFSARVVATEARAPPRILTRQWPSWRNEQTPVMPVET